jgi:dihydroneopterin aldolase
MLQYDMEGKNLDAVEMQDACICKVQMCDTVQYTKLIQTTRNHIQQTRNLQQTDVVKLTVNYTTALFWAITQRVVVISYRCFKTTYQSHLQGSRFLTVMYST